MSYETPSDYRYVILTPDQVQHLKRVDVPTVDPIISQFLDRALNGIVLKVANASERLALQNPVDGQLVEQLDNNSLWAYNINILSWVSVGGGGSGVLFGDPASGFSPGMFQYVDASGNQFGDLLATRDSGNSKQTQIESNVYAQLILNDGVTKTQIQADNVGVPFSLTFDGVIDINQAVLDWNTANPLATVTVISGTGTEIISAGTYSSVGAGTTGLQMGEVNAIPIPPSQGSAQYLNDTANGNVAFNFAGNLTTLFGETTIGTLNGFFGAGGVNVVSSTAFRVQLFSSDLTTYQATHTADSGGSGLDFNGASFEITASDYVFEDNSGNQFYWSHPFTPPSVGDVMTITNVAGSSYQMEFQPPSGGGGTPGGADTYVQYNDGGSFGGDDQFLWQKTTKNFFVGDLNGSTFGHVFSVENSLNVSALVVPSGQIKFGDSGNINTSLQSNINTQLNSYTVSGFIPVNAGFANINTSGVTGLNDLAVAGSWFDNINNAYTVQITFNNKKAIRVGSVGILFTVGDTIENDSFPGETAVVDAISGIAATNEYWLICDQSFGPWNTPASITITAGVNVGATAGVSNFYDDNDIFSVSGSASSGGWPMGLSFQLAGAAAFGWSSFTGHTIGDTWVIGFAANPYDIFRADLTNSEIYIGYHSGVPQDITPNSIFIKQSGSVPSRLTIGQNAQAGYITVHEANKFLFQNFGTTNTYLNLEGGSIYQIGAIGGIDNKNSYNIDDTNEQHTFIVSDVFQSVDTFNKRFIYATAGNKNVQIGDLDAVGNSNTFSVIDSSNEIVAQTDGSFKVRDLLGNIIFEANAATLGGSLGDVSAVGNQNYFTASDAGNDMRAVLGNNAAFVIRGGVGGDAHIMFNAFVPESRITIQDTRFETDKGANVAAANDLTLGGDGNVFTITGNTQINAITTQYWQAGSQIVLIFSGSPTVKHNTAGGAGTAVMLLAGSTDLSATANTVLGLVYDGTQWQEMYRKVP